MPGIFPEGGISRDLEPRAGRTGVARLAGWSGAPVVPVGLWGTHRLAAPGHGIHPRLGVAVVASVGDPLSVHGDEDIHQATDRIMAAICAEVGRARSSYPNEPRRGEGSWWLREPGSAQFRSCQPAVDSMPARPRLTPEPEPACAPREVRRSGGEAVLQQQLRSIPFFRNLPAEALGAVSSRLQAENHERGDIVFHQGDPGETMYLVASGQVDVVAGADRAPLASLGPGTFVGELALLLGEPRSATLRVTSDACLWALHRGDLDAILADHPTVGIELSRELGRRLVATNRRIAAPVTTRFTGVWGEGVAPLAAALQRLPGTGRIGVLTLPGAWDIALPDGVTAIAANPLDPEALTGMAGNDVDGLAHLLIALPPSETPLARAGVTLAEHIVAFRPAAGWVVHSGSPRRLLRSDGSAESLARVARWVSGRAVGLALSSGGSKALAHVGVLRVLRRAGVTIDAVAGTSGGAIVAAGLAFGLSEDDMLGHVNEMAASLRLRRFDFNVLPRSALFKGVSLRHQLDGWYGGKTFADSSIPCWVVATDVSGGAEVVIDSGPVADGVRASMSIPGAMNPWPVAGRMCIDGAVVNPMPASVLRDAGLRLVIGSNVAGQELAPEGLAGNPHMLQIMSRMVNSMEREMIKAQVPLVDVLIRPVVGRASSFDFSRITEFVAEGERAAEEQLPEIKVALESLAG